MYDNRDYVDRMIDHANDLKSITKQYNVPLVINDRVDVAILVGTFIDGVICSLMLMVFILDRMICLLLFADGCWGPTKSWVYLPRL